MPISFGIIATVIFSPVAVGAAPAGWAGVGACVVSGARWHAGAVRSDKRRTNVVRRFMLLHWAGPSVLPAWPRIDAPTRPWYNYVAGRHDVSNGGRRVAGH